MPAGVGIHCMEARVGTQDNARADEDGNTYSMGVGWTVPPPGSCRRRWAQWAGIQGKGSIVAGARGA